MKLPDCLSVWMSVCLEVYTSTCMSYYLTVWKSVYPSGYLFGCLSESLTNKKFVVFYMLHVDFPEKKRAF